MANPYTLAASLTAPASGSAGMAVLRADLFNGQCESRTQQILAVSPPDSRDPRPT